MRFKIGTAHFILTVAAIALLGPACVEKTIRVGVPRETPVPSPPLRVEANVRLEDFRKLCNFLPEEGDRMDEKGSGEGGKTVEVTLGNTKRRQNPSAMRAGCTPGATFIFSGPELRLQ
jgi:hypothetical protein